jgi:hypothetical protein
MLWDTSNNKPVGDSSLIGETQLDPIPPFSDHPGAPLNWVVAHSSTPFDTTPYSGKSLVLGFPCESMQSIYIPSRGLDPWVHGWPGPGRAQPRG